jgi:hypothetical protein
LQLLVLFFFCIPEQEMRPVTRWGAAAATTLLGGSDEVQAWLGSWRQQGQRLEDVVVAAEERCGAGKGFWTTAARLDSKVISDRWRLLVSLQAGGTGLWALGRGRSGDAGLRRRARARGVQRDAGSLDVSSGVDVVV